MELRVDGKRVVITAAASGIGRVMLDVYRDAGAKLFISDIDPKGLEDLRGSYPDIGVMACDVAVTEQVDAFVDGALAAMGGIDVLVNNAGIAGPALPVEDVEPEEFDRVLAVNIGGQFRMARKVVPGMKAAGAGVIINLSSAAGKFGFPLRTPYSASKWAVVGFSKTLAAELGPFGIRVNSILPGPVDGERIRRVISDKAETRGVSFAQVEEEFLATSSMGVMIDPLDLARLALYLATDAGKAISGQSLSVDGDTRYLR